MIEWFKNLDVAWQTTIFAVIIVPVLGWLLKLSFGRKNNSSKIQTEVSLPKPETDDAVPIAKGLGPIAKIINGSITYHSNTLGFKPLAELKTSIIGGYVKRNDFGKLEAYIQTDVQVQSLQRLNEQLGLDSMRMFSENDTISENIDNPVVFTSSTSHILPQGEMVLNLSTWKEEPFPMTMHVQTQTIASGHLEGKVFQGKFEAILTYRESKLQIGLNGDFQVHLA